MKSDDLSRDFNNSIPGNRDVTWRQGIVLSWNDLTGANVVDVSGEEIEDMKAVQAGIGISYSPGDVVMVSRKQSTYFILGKVAAAGGAAGSAIRGNTLGAAQSGLGSTGGAWVDFADGGPSVNAYIGSSRSALVLITADIQAQQTKGLISWRTTGASAIAAAAFTGMAANFGVGGTVGYGVGTATAQYAMGAGAGLKQGLNTFTMQYQVDTGYGGGSACTFTNRGITVIPL